jgi:microcystin degradation protein MlrC
MMGPWSKPTRGTRTGDALLGESLPLLVLFLLFPLLGACAPGATADTFRVAVYTYSHETCTFCPGPDVEVEDWQRVLEGNQVLRGGGYTGGFVNLAREYGDMELVGLTSPSGIFGGSSRPWHSEASFEHWMGIMRADLEAVMPLDGVFLDVHGAAAVRNVPRPEAEIARRIREVVGPHVPIVATFDLHGNEDEEFLRWADGSFVTKRFPHYDAWLQGERAARYLRLVMRGDYRPTTATIKPPILTASVLQWTGASPVMDIMERARRWEAREPGAFVSVFLGFPWSDVPDVGALVQVMTNDDQELANRIAQDMAEYMWRVREDWAWAEYPLPDEAVRMTRAAIAAGETPVLLADYSDRLGDATWILRELMDQGVGRVLFASLSAQPTLDEIWERDLQPGDPFEGEVGGYTGEQAGEPVGIRGTLAWRGSALGYDQVAAIEFGEGSMLILVPAYQQTTAPEQLRFGPIEPDDYDVFVSNTRAHFRRGFYETGYARTIILVDAPGDWFGTVRLNALEYENVDITAFYPFGDPPAPRVVEGRSGGVFGNR